MQKRHLARFLLENVLLDELTLTEHPVVAGNGKRPFRDGSDLKRLRLVDSKTTRTSTVILTYQHKVNPLSRQRPTHQPLT
jgi:dihydrofolate reductase